MLQVYQVQKCHSLYNHSSENEMIGSLYVFFYILYNTIATDTMLNPTICLFVLWAVYKPPCWISMTDSKIVYSSPTQFLGSRIILQILYCCSVHFLAEKKWYELKGMFVQTQETSLTLTSFTYIFTNFLFIRHAMSLVVIILKTRLGCFYVTAILSWGYGWGWAGA